MFAKAIPAFNFDQKEKIGSWIGFLLTLVGIIMFLSISITLLATKYWELRPLVYDLVAKDAYSKRDALDLV